METNHIETAATAFARVKELMMGSGWIAFEHKFGADIKAEKKALPGKSVEIARAEGVVENVTPETLFNLVFNQTFEEKKKSDDSMLADEIVESINDDIRIVYQAYSAPWPVSGRDILLNRSKVVEDGVYWQVDVSTSHAKKPNPTGSFVRADLIGCYRYAPHEKGVLVTYVVYMDPMGNIPSFLVNASMSKVPARVASFRTMKK